MSIILFYAEKYTLEDENDVLLIDSDYQFSDEEDNNFYNLMLNKQTHNNAENEVSILLKYNFILSLSELIFIYYFIIEF